MIKDIWHITNQNKNPTDIPEKENFIILDGVLGNSGLWYGGEEPIIFWENVKRWCYLDELILEKERTRKALEIAVDALGVISQITNQIDVCDTANDSLNAITTLEQKDVK